MVRFIESKQNPLIKEALRIKDRKEKGHLLIEGEHPIEMAHASRFRIIRVFVSREYKNSTLLKQLSKKAEIIETTEKIISILSDTEHPQGIVAVTTYETLDLDALPSGENPIFVISDRIQEPGNLGTIIRTADAAGANAVIIIPGSCDPFMQKVIRASAGSIFNIPIVFSGKGQLMEWLRSKGIRLIATAPSSKKMLYELDLKGSIAFVFGNEAQGVSDDLIAGADEIVRIPIFGKAESLNVSVAASICLYEAVRQRLQSKTSRHF